jgi:cytochrome c oxidase subunit IV
VSGKARRGAHGAPRAPQAHDAGVGPYFAVFAALMLFTALTVWAAFQHLGVWNTPLALAIAVTKALLVAWIFMHLRHSPKLTIFVVAASVLWLAFLILITASDYLTRAWLPIYAR